jgi:hypothetical protein
MTSKEVSVKTAVTATVLLTVLALTGCGNSAVSTRSEPAAQAVPLSRAAYSAELQQVGSSLVAALNSLGKTSADFARIERNVPRGQAALRRAAARLAGTIPPTDARTDNANLVSGLRFFAVRLNRMRAAAARHDRGAVVAADEGIDRSRAVRAMMAAAADLQHAGYSLGELAPSNKP